MKKKREEPPHPQYDLMCTLNDFRDTIKTLRFLIDKLDADIVDCLRTIREPKEQ